MNAEPENLALEIVISVLVKGDTNRIKEIASSQHVDNETTEWDCQDYLLELLEKLEDEYILDGDDEEYCEAKKELKKRRGAIV